MLKRLLFLFALVPVTAMASPKSQASLGLGAGSTVGGTSGILVEKHLSEAFGVQGVAGFTAGGGRFGVGIGAYGVSPIVGGSSGGVAAVYGLDLHLTQVPDTAGDGFTSLDVGIGGGLRGDVYLGPQLSVFFQTGLSVWRLGKGSTSTSLGFQPDSDVRASSTALQIGPRNALATLGFTWWFNN